MSAAERFFAGHVTDVEKATSRTVELDGRRIALFRSDSGDFFATADSCTHEQWSLGTDGEIEDAQVVCPLHLARFDLRTGEARCFPATEALKTYSVEIDDDDKIFVIVD